MLHSGLRRITGSTTANFGSAPALSRRRSGRVMSNLGLDLAVLSCHVRAIQLASLLADRSAGSQPKSSPYNLPTQLDTRFHTNLRKSVLSFHKSIYNLGTCFRHAT